MTFSAAAFVPNSRSYLQLASAVQQCQGCRLFQGATQAVFGKGPVPSALMVVGESPGDREDHMGRPFVGPAGQLLQKTFTRLGIKQDHIYLTNAVKHFKFINREDFRLHQKPSTSEINACRPWLEAELAMVKPKVVLCLGATALQSLLKRTVRIADIRGQFIPHSRCGFITVTVHPSSLLRIPDARLRQLEYERFVAEVKSAYERTK